MNKSPSRGLIKIITVFITSLAVAAPALAKPHSVATASGKPQIVDAVWQASVSGIDFRVNVLAKGAKSLKKVTTVVCYADVCQQAKLLKSPAVFDAQFNAAIPLSQTSLPIQVVACSKFGCSFKDLQAELL